MDRLHNTHEHTVITRHVLVTGASGFLGRALVAGILKAGYSVRAVVRRPVSFPKSIDVVVIPDFKNRIDWAPLLEGIDIVVHAAALAHADARTSEHNLFDQVNHLTTRDLARAAKCAKVERLVFISSVRAQIGACSSRVVREADEAQPTDDYGRSKLAAELAIRDSGVRYTILRPVVVYGAKPKGNINTLVQIASTCLPLPFAGLKNRRSMLARDNLIDAIFFALSHQETVNETFLVADREPLTLGQIFTMLRKAQGHRPQLFFVPPALVHGLLMITGRTSIWERVCQDLVVDTEKLASLGWSPPVDTPEGFNAMIQMR